MSKRNRHVPKTTAHKRAYREAIETLDYEPTVDERLNFRPTNQTGDELREEPTAGKRPSSAAESLQHHVAKNWPLWALALIGIAIVYLLYDSRVASAKISTQLESQGEHLAETRTTVRDSERHDQKQDIKIAESNVKIDGISKNLDETKAEVKALRGDVQSVVTLIKSQQPPERDK